MRKSVLLKIISNL